MVFGTLRKTEKGQMNHSFARELSLLHNQKVRSRGQQEGPAALAAHLSQDGV